MFQTTIDSVRTHNELLHSGYAKYVAYSIPVLVVFVFAWVRFMKS